MNAIHFFYVLTVSLGLAVGQLMFKKAATTIQFSGSLFAILTNSLSNFWLLSSLVLYGLLTIAWIYILKTVPLSLAYPLTSVCFIVVPLASHILFNDIYNWRIALSGIFIAIGLVIMGLEFK